MFYRILDAADLRILARGDVCVCSDWGSTMRIGPNDLSLVFKVVVVLALVIWSMVFRLICGVGLVVKSE